MGSGLKEFLRTWYLRFIYFPFNTNARPPQFTKCWEYPRVTTFGPGVNSQSRFIVIYPMNDWHTRRQRHHYLVEALVRLGYQCIYLNPNLGREYSTLFPRERLPILCSLAAGIYELHVRLPLEPVFHSRLLTHRESGRVARAVANALQNLGVCEAVQVVNLPTWFAAAKMVRSRHRHPIIYDCHDLLSGFANMARDIVDAEPAAMAASDAVLFSSIFLRDRFTIANPDLTSVAAVLRNAVQADLFRAAPAHPPQAMAVYVGAIETWFDESLVAEAARRLPHCRFVLAGRVDEPRVMTLAALPNVEFLGEIPYSDSPALLARASVGMIPFALNDLTRASNPLKLYEYFAAGLPVVSVPLPELEQFKDLLYLASTPSAFAGAVEAALAENDGSLRAERAAIAGRETWNSRAVELDAIITSL